MELKIQPNKQLGKEGKVKGFFGKELLTLPKGTVKLVEISPKSSYPEHVHPDKTEYAYVLQGKPEFVIGTQQFEGEKGDFYIFPAKEKHAILNTTNETCCILVGAIEIP